MLFKAALKPCHRKFLMIRLIRKFADQKKIKVIAVIERSNVNSTRLSDNQWFLI